MHASSGLQTHDHIIRAIADSRHLTLNGYCVHLLYNSTNKYMCTNAGLSRAHRLHKRLLRTADFNTPSKFNISFNWYTFLLLLWSHHDHYCQSRDIMQHVNKIVNRKHCHCCVSSWQQQCTCCDRVTAKFFIDSLRLFSRIGGTSDSFRQSDWYLRVINWD
jgi:hypothetical protein